MIATIRIVTDMASMPLSERTSSSSSAVSGSAAMSMPAAIAALRDSESG